MGLTSWKQQIRRTPPATMIISFVINILHSVFSRMSGVLRGERIGIIKLKCQPVFFRKDLFVLETQLLGLSSD